MGFFSQVLNMIKTWILKLFGSRNERVIKGILPVVEQVASFEPALEKLSDEQLRAKTTEFRKRLDAGETLDDLLPEAYACVRESSKRFRLTDTGVPMRHYDVQIIGGLVLHRGGIAEMVTGEGKTLVATLAAYLNALPGKGVHVITVNDYLARRDAEWMQPVYEGLGLTVGSIQSDMDSLQRREQYECDITYGTNNEFGFDYLRDNMKVRPEEQCQRRQHFAIIDEVDSILVDEARTPLIISGPAEGATDKYYEANRVAGKLEKEKHFELKEKEHSVILTEEGIERAEKLVGVDSFYTPANMSWPHHLEQALRAHHLYQLDVDYVKQDGTITIVDEFTGRLMEGRRWSDGLHQAVEAKEGVKIKDETQTLATITFQNFFRLYNKISGMTGTAMTEATEFAQIYKLGVVAIPTNREMLRENLPDVVYRTKREKWLAIADRVAEVNQTGRPLLVGTISIEDSELLSGLLKRRGVNHSVLNAKYHAKEAEIITNAGQKSQVTIATNMAGRGTDIVLGDGVKELGGLFVLGTERHESRRIDNQLRGRCGRQGDPGTSQFFVSLEDGLMRLFASDWVSNFLKRMGMEDGVAIESRLVSRRIEGAQKKVEGRNFEIRKNLLEYDQVMDEQRKLIYTLRDRILMNKDLVGIMRDHIRDVAEGHLESVVAGDADAEEAVDGVAQFSEWLKDRYGIDVTDSLAQAESNDNRIEVAVEAYDKVLQGKRSEAGDENFDRLLHFILLTGIDDKWKDHLHGMDQMRAGIGLRSYAQIDPKLEYKREGYSLFSQMLAAFKEDSTQLVPRLRFQIDDEEAQRRLESTWEGSSEVNPGQVEEDFNQHGAQMDRGIAGSKNDKPAEPIRNTEDKVGRNDPCPCGSGKKLKKCCGK